MRKVYVWSYLLYYLTLRKSYRPEARGYVVYFPRALPEGEDRGQCTREINHMNIEILS